MAEPRLAHLNGGPRDGEVVILPPGRMMYHVPGHNYVLAPGRFEDGPRVTVRVGTYCVRLNALGEPVPHDLQSTEFDWTGWEH